ncbi:hypothetical protein GEMRC1_001650 [Eukaryota sp. GEM-RC1]
MCSLVETFWFDSNVSLDFIVRLSSVFVTILQQSILIDDISHSIVFATGPSSLQACLKSIADTGLSVLASEQDIMRITQSVRLKMVSNSRFDCSKYESVLSEFSYLGKDFLMYQTRWIVFEQLCIELQALEVQLLEDKKE